MESFAAVTIVAHNYIPQARILARSFLDHHADSIFYVVVVDRPLEVVPDSDPRIRVLAVSEIDFDAEGFEYMAAIYDVTEFATAVKPFALRQLLAHHECVFYIDPDVKIYSTLAPLVEMTTEFGWSLTPHVTKPIPRDMAEPTEQGIKAAGIYNLGFVGVTGRAMAMLNWWADRLRRDSIVDLHDQLFTDQRWIDMAVAVFPAYIERSTSYNVAYWNIDQRNVWRDGNKYMVDDDELRFFHFSGYDPARPHWISKHQSGVPRFLLSENLHVADLFSEYGKELLKIRDEIARSKEYGWRNIIPGLPWTPALRRYVRQSLIDAEHFGETRPPTPFAPGGASRFVSWLREPNSRDASGLPRHIAALYWSRPDLQVHFPEVTSGDLENFRYWLKDRGPVESETVRFLGTLETEHHVESTRPVRVAKKPIGVDLVGYLNAEQGVGEAGRLACNALRRCGIPTTAIHYSRTQSRQNLDFASGREARFQTMFLSANADQVPVIVNDLGPSFVAGSYVISQWFWELEQLPRWYSAAYPLVDEIWAPTSFIYEALRSHIPDGKNLRLMNLPLLTPVVDSHMSRAKFGFGDEFVFLFSFDFLSVAKRKNPLGVVEAYRRAFSSDTGTRLVIKSINGHLRLDELEALRWAMRDRRDIEIMDTYLDFPTVAALMKASDCYVSLHRSEGLGLTIAEAMLLEKPVIATAYGGNMDFMNQDISVLVPWKRVPVGSGAEAYQPDATWAEPDLDVAASAMRFLFEDREKAREIGLRARKYLEDNFSLEVCGQKMADRLHQIWKEVES